MGIRSDTRCIPKGFRVLLCVSMRTTIDHLGGDEAQSSITEGWIENSHNIGYCEIHYRVDAP